MVEAELQENIKGCEVKEELPPTTKEAFVSSPPPQQHILRIGTGNDDGNTHTNRSAGGLPRLHARGHVGAAALPRGHPGRLRRRAGRLLLLLLVLLRRLLVLRPVLSTR